MPTVPALWSVLAVSGRLGLTSFGGPIAHLGFFHREYVEKRRWLDERSYGDLVALCQVLPGPASSQLGIAIGTLRCGVAGGIAAWVGFTLPSAFFLFLFAVLMRGVALEGAGWIHGLKVVAVAVVAQAVLTMGRRLAADASRATVAILSMTILLAWRTALSQVLVIVAAGIAGLALFRSAGDGDTAPPPVPVSRRTGVACLAVFFALLIALPAARSLAGNRWVAVADAFYRSGSLVFGGGHVVLPLLEREVVPTGWVTRDDFLAGYAAAQAVPGPLFTFSAYLGALIGGAAGAALALASIFLPAFLLIVGALPFWGMIRADSRIRAALDGINAAVVGILLAALYDPLWTSAVRAPADVGLAAVLFGLLQFWKLPPWVAVIAGAAGGALVSWLAPA